MEVAGMSQRAADLERTLRQREVLWTVASLLGVAVACWVIAILSDAFIAPLRGGVATSLLTMFLPVLLFNVPLIGMLWVFLRQMAPRPPGTVFVWLRRFHLTGRGRTPFHRLLGKASFGLGTVFTIRDTSFPTNVLRGAFTSFVVVLLVLLVVLVVPRLLFLVGIVFTRALNIGGSASTVSLAASAALALGGTLIAGRLVYGFAARRGVIELNGASAVAKVTTLLRTMRNAPHRMPGGIVVARTADDVWQPVVKAAIENANVVIVDVTDPPASVLWELHMALESIAPERIVLAQGFVPLDDDALGNAMAGDRRAPPWASTLGDCASLLGRVRWFHYPTHSKVGVQLATAKRLRHLLLEIVAPVVEVVPPPGQRMRVIKNTIAACASAAALLFAARALVPPPLAPEELTPLVLVAVGAPDSYIVSASGRMKRPPNDRLVATLRATTFWEGDGKYQDAVNHLLDSHDDADNPWLLLARGRAFLLNSECSCPTPMVVQVLGDGRWQVDKHLSDEESLRSDIGRLEVAAGGRRIVFLQPVEGAPLESIERLAGAIGRLDDVVAVAPADMGSLARLCGAKATVSGG
jgi:hypothetical protein